jgi:hypothetical protein
MTSVRPLSCIAQPGIAQWFVPLGAADVLDETEQFGLQRCVRARP